MRNVGAYLTTAYLISTRDASGESHVLVLVGLGGLWDKSYLFHFEGNRLQDILQTVGCCWRLLVSPFFLINLTSGEGVEDVFMSGRTECPQG
jgi:hypothetical protein